MVVAGDELSAALIKVMVIDDSLVRNSSVFKPYAFATSSI